MWNSIVIAVNLLVCTTAAVPPPNDIAKSFQAAVQQQNMHTILMSIEERLRNLDNIYSLNLSPTLEDKLEQYQRKLEALDTKIIRLESIVTLHLDKMSENISTKNFKDEIAKITLLKRMDTIYEGLSHRINYLERKLDNSNSKIQSKLETTLARLENLEESLTRRNEELEIDISDAVGAIEDLKTLCNRVEDNVINNTNENFEVFLKKQSKILTASKQNNTERMEKMLDNTTQYFLNIEETFKKEVKALNSTDVVNNMKQEIQRELNEYAIKVAETNLENWKMNTNLKENQVHLENIMNSTMNEVYNGLRTLILLISKPNKDCISKDNTQMDKLNQKIDTNFEKVFSAQNLFMDNCYRLQMDESQIEDKISVILEKLMDTFDKKTAIELKDIKNIERLIKSHDSHVNRNLYQISSNTVTVHEKVSKDHNQLEDHLKQIMNHLNALFSLVQDTLVNEDTEFSSKNDSQLTSFFDELKQKIELLLTEQDNVTETLEEIRNIAQNIHHNKSLEKIYANIKDLTVITENLKTKMNTLYIDYYQHKSNNTTFNISLQIKELKDIINKKILQDAGVGTELSTNTPYDIEKKLEEIFGTPAPNLTHDMSSVEGNTDNIKFPESNKKLEVPIKKCEPNLLDVIDVRSNIDNTNNCSQENENIDQTESYLETTSEVITL